MISGPKASLIVAENQGMRIAWQSLFNLTRAATKLQRISEKIHGKVYTHSNTNTNDFFTACIKENAINSASFFG
jgi:hypothetical protein